MIVKREFVATMLRMPMYISDLYNDERRDYSIHFPLPLRRSAPPSTIPVCPCAHLIYAVQSSILVLDTFAGSVSLQEIHFVFALALYPPTWIDTECFMYSVLSLHSVVPFLV